MSASAGSTESIHLPCGFSFSAVAAGIKASGRLDLALAEAAPGTTAAAMFTKNRVVAAPVEIGRKHLRATGAHVHAVIVNSGNANCATGKGGLMGCVRICREAAALLAAATELVFPSSTGVIGVPLPVERIISKLPELIAHRAASKHAAAEFARAIMTTDTRPKLASAEFRSGGATARILGIAKGAGMIHPQLATMLVYLFTDVAAAPAELKRSLHAACDETFNCISVDGDTSTNDTVLLMASGQSSIRVSAVKHKFQAALQDVCRSLAEQIVADGEGVQHVIRLSIEQAKSREEALHVGRSVARSLLVKTAWAGADPNWGRILAAIGASGVNINPNKVDIFLGRQMVCRNGAALTFDEAQAHAELARPSSDVRIILHRGRASAVFLATDLTAEYVRINADYST
jgi:glutamate N-acetyltransferase / amino-acid N-acetyltransferase